VSRAPRLLQARRKEPRVGVFELLPVSALLEVISSHSNIVDTSQSSWMKTKSSEVGRAQEGRQGSSKPQVAEEQGL
jgi:hypothetical protein